LDSFRYEKKIIAAHEKISHLPKDEALSKYLLTASTLPNYGMTFFQGIVIFFNLSLFLLLFSYFLFGL